METQHCEPFTGGSGGVLICLYAVVEAQKFHVDKIILSWYTKIKAVKASVNDDRVRNTMCSVCCVTKQKHHIRKHIVRIAVTHCNYAQKHRKTHAQTDKSRERLKRESGHTSPILSSNGKICTRS